MHKDYGVRGWNDSPDRMTPQSFPPSPRDRMTPHVVLSLHGISMELSCNVSVYIAWYQAGIGHGLTQIKVRGTHSYCSVANALLICCHAHAYHDAITSSITTQLSNYPLVSHIYLFRLSDSE